MLKRLLVFHLLIISLSTGLFFTHQAFLFSKSISLSFLLSQVYIFNILSTAIICITAELLNKKLPTQVGYAYLATVFVKMGFFVLIFKDVIFNDSGFLMTDRLSMVIPTMLFLIIEAVYCGRLMNKQ